MFDIPHLLDILPWQISVVLWVVVMVLAVVCMEVYIRQVKPCQQWLVEGAWLLFSLSYTCLFCFLWPVTA